MSAKGLTESQFYMWRTLFAIVHVDNVVASEEIRFMAEALEDVPFSDAQRTILNDDIKNPQNIEAMFGGISDVRDQAAFFNYARSLVHIDGEYGAAEQVIMLKLQKLHMQNANLADLVGNVSLELEDDEPVRGVSQERPKTFRDKVSSFRDRFMKDR